MPKETAATFEQQRGGRGYKVYEAAVPGAGVFLRFLRHPKPLPLSAPWKGHQRPLLDGRVFGLNSLHLAPPALGPSSLCPRRRVSSQGSGAQGKAVEHKTLAFQPQHLFPPSLLLRVSRLPTDAKHRVTHSPFHPSRLALRSSALPRCKLYTVNKT